jgi:hypothetical protein
MKNKNNEMQEVDNKRKRYRETYKSTKNNTVGAYQQNGKYKTSSDYWLVPDTSRTAKEKMEEWSDKWFKETRTEKLEPNIQLQKSLEWSGAKEQNPSTIVDSEDEEDKRNERICKIFYSFCVTF